MGTVNYISDVHDPKTFSDSVDRDIAYLKELAASGKIMEICWVVKFKDSYQTGYSNTSSKVAMAGRTMRLVNELLKDD